MSSEIIDEIDAKILKDLLLNGRKKFTAIAKEAHVSKDVICQRYKNMKKRGIIGGTTVMIDYKALGYNINASAYISVPAQEQQLVIEQLCKVPGLYDIYEWGSSALWSVVHLTDTEQIESVKKFIKRVPSVNRLEFDIWVGIRFMMTNLSILSNKNSLTDTNIRVTGDSKIKRDLIEADEIDRQIIEKLVYDGRAPFSSIAKKIGISTSTVMRRYQELARKKVIRPIIQINLSKLGYPADVNFRLITNPQDDLGNVADSISKIPDIYVIFKLIGSHDLMVFACAKSLEHLFDLELQIANVPGVQKVEKVTVLSRPLACAPFPGVAMSNF
jgi:Lrp/AsnC family transcriptional regulator for asnA, asnC and gidA